MKGQVCQIIVHPAVSELLIAAEAQPIPTTQGLPCPTHHQTSISEYRRLFDLHIHEKRKEEREQGREEVK